MAGLPPTDDSPLKVYMKGTKRSSKQPPKIVQMPERDDSQHPKKRGPKQGSKRSRPVSALTEDDIPDLEIGAKSGTGNLCTIMENFSDAQKKDVIDIGFGGLLQMKLQDNISHQLYNYLVTHFNPHARNVIVGKKEHAIHIDSSDIADVLGIPFTDIPVKEISKMKKTINPDEYLKIEWRRFLGLDLEDDSEQGKESEGQNQKKRKTEEKAVQGRKKKKTYVNMETYMMMFESCRDGGADFKKLFVMFAVSTFLAPIADKSPNFNIIKSLEDVRFIKAFNWAGYVMDFLCSSITDFQAFVSKIKEGKELKTKSKQVNGCLVAFVIAFIQKFEFGTSLQRKPFISNWTCESLNKRIKSVAENMDYGTVRLYPAASPKQYAGKSEQALLKTLMLDSIEFKIEDSDEDEYLDQKKEKKKEDQVVQSTSFKLKDIDDKARYVMYKIPKEFPTDAEIDNMDIDPVKKKMMKFGRDLKIVSENQIDFAIDLKDEAKSYSQESQSQGEDDLYSNPEFLAKIDAIVEAAMHTKTLATDLDQFNKTKLKSHAIVNAVISDLGLQEDRIEDAEQNLEDTSMPRSNLITPTPTSQDTPVFQEHNAHVTEKEEVQETSEKGNDENKEDDSTSKVFSKSDDGIQSKATVELALTTYEGQQEEQPQPRDACAVVELLRNKTVAVESIPQPIPVVSIPLDSPTVATGDNIQKDKIRSTADVPGLKQRQEKRLVSAADGLDWVLPPIHKIPLQMKDKIVCRNLQANKPLYLKRLTDNELYMCDFLFFMHYFEEVELDPTGEDEEVKRRNKSLYVKDTGTVICQIPTEDPDQSDIILVKEEFCSLRPSEWVNSAIHDTWATVLNIEESKITNKDRGVSQYKRFVFQTEVANVSWIYLEKRAVYIKEVAKIKEKEAILQTLKHPVEYTKCKEELLQMEMDSRLNMHRVEDIYDCITQWVRRFPSFNICEAKLLIIPIAFDYHHTLLVFNFIDGIGPRIDWINNRTDINRDSLKGIDIVLIRAVGIFLKKHAHPHGEKNLEELEWHEPKFTWQTSHENEDCGLFTLMCMKNYNGTSGGLVDLKVKQNRNIYRCQLAYQMATREENILRKTLWNDCIKFSINKHKIWKAQPARKKLEAKYQKDKQAIERKKEKQRKLIQKQKEKEETEKQQLGIDQQLQKNEEEEEEKD